MPIRPGAALRALVVTCALLLAGGALFFAGGALAHEGHDHGAEPAPVPSATAPRAEAASERFELVAVVQGGDLVFYLDRFSTNEPVPDAVVAVSVPGEGRKKATETTPGTYRLPAPWLAGQEHTDLMVGITQAGATDILNLDLDMPPQTAPTVAAAPSLGERLAHQSPAALAGGGFLMGLGAFALMRRRRAVPVLAVLFGAAALLVTGAAFAHDGHEGGRDRAEAPAERGGAAHVHLNGETAQTHAALTSAPLMERARRLSDGSVFVPKSMQRLLVLRTETTTAQTVSRTTELPGRVIADPNASGVVQSSVGGRLAAPAGGFPRLGTRVRRGDVLATVTPPVQAVDVSDMRQRQGELDQQIAILERRVVRFERLSSTGAVAQTQLDDARSELGGLKDRRGALDAIRSIPESLIAPVDGVVAEANAVAGAMAAPGTVVYRIIDPRKLWVEALSFEALAEGASATARLGDGTTLALAYRGAGLADRNQAVPVQFAIPGDASALRLGQFVTVLAPTGGERRGVPLPRGGLVRSEGGSLVYEHVGAERFIGRPVRVAPLDADRMLVSDGVEPGRRVVVQGAELLDQIR